MSNVAKKASELQRKIVQAKQDLDEINKLEQPMPELINTTNMLRSNEYLTKANEKQSKLLVTYEEYAKELEKLVLSTSVIKAKIKTLKRRSKPRRTSKRKSKRKKKAIRKRTKKKRRAKKAKRKRKTKSRKRRR